MTKLESLRRDKKMSISQVSKEIGVSSYKYKSIEMNPLTATPSIAIRLSNLFSMTIEDIFLSR